MPGSSSTSSTTSSTSQQGSTTDMTENPSTTSDLSELFWFVADISVKMTLGGNLCCFPNTSLHYRDTYKFISSSQVSCCFYGCCLFQRTFVEVFWLLGALGPGGLGFKGCPSATKLGGETSRICWIFGLAHIFQTGWFNHQHPQTVGLIFGDPRTKTTNPNLHQMFHELILLTFF